MEFDPVFVAMALLRLLLKRMEEEPIPQLPPDVAGVPHHVIATLETSGAHSEHDFSRLYLEPMAHAFHDEMLRRAGTAGIRPDSIARPDPGAKAIDPKTGYGLTVGFSALHNCWVAAVYFATSS